MRAALRRRKPAHAPLRAGQIGSVVFGKQESERMTEWRNVFRVGVYTCAMTYRPGRELKVEWRPDMPNARSFSAQMMAEYRAGRDALLAEVATAIGGNVVVVEV